ncbi:Nn.00g106660.m01.CDS01 [Neocucurbitaria sp. VM-36]
MSLVQLLTYDRVFLQWLLEMLSYLPTELQFFVFFVACQAVFKVIETFYNVCAFVLGLINAFYAVCTYENVEMFGAMTLVCTILLLLCTWDSDFVVKSLWKQPSCGSSDSLTQHGVDDASHEKPSHSAPDDLHESPISPSSSPSASTPAPPSYWPFENLYSTGTGESFLPHHSYSLKKDPTIQYPLFWKDTVFSKAVMPPSIKEPEVSQRPIATEPRPVAKVETAMPAYKPTTSQTAPPPAALQVPKPVRVVAPSLPVTATQAPQQVVLAAPAQPTVVAQPTVKPSFEDMVGFVFAFFAAKSDGLRAAMLAFVLASSPRECEEPAAAVRGLFGEALKSLQVFFPSGLSAAQSTGMGWNAIIEDFWGHFRPHGYALQQHGSQELVNFFNDVFQFGQYLGLPLLPLDCTPPPPPPPAPLPQSPHLPPPPMPQASPAYPVQQQAVATAKRTEAVQAPPMVSKPTRDQPVEPVSEVLDFDTYVWTKKETKALNELTKESFGWTNAKVWQFSCAKDFVLSAYDAANWANPFYVRGELNRKAGALKKAAVILRMQAKAGDLQDHTSLAPLLNEMKAWFKKAAEITDKCGGLKSNELDSWMSWYDACLYFHNEVFAETDIRRALRKQYGVDEWSSFEKVWTAGEDKWLADEED